MNYAYTIRPAAKRPSLQGDWDGDVWGGAERLELANFLPQTPSRHARVEVKALYQEDGFFVFFKVRDKYVRSVKRNYQDQVCTDSCVEFFVEPRPGLGYFNFEINCGGTLLLYYCLRRDPAVRPVYDPLPWELGRQVILYHSMPDAVDPEIQADTEWRIEFFAPFSIFAPYVGPVTPAAGQTWRGNFYKCGGDTSHPHYQMWAPMGTVCDFHLPQYFAPIRFAPA